MVIIIIMISGLITRQGVDFGLSRECSSSSCAFCGKPNHHFTECIERRKGIPCNFCHMFNHASNMCRFKDRQVNFIHARVNTHANMEEGDVGKTTNGKSITDQLIDKRISHSIVNEGDIDSEKLSALYERHDSNKFNHDAAILVCVQERYDSQQVIKHSITSNRRDGHYSLPTGIIEIELAGRKVRAIVDSGAEVRSA
jgi:hypothetical protein